MSGGGLPATYIAAQFHLHWGNDATDGSEHTKGGEPLPAEVSSALCEYSLKV
jgi:hypothetical protein